jgi:hypothetical protein
MVLRSSYDFDLPFEILRNCVFMIRPAWHKRTALAVSVMLPLLVFPGPAQGPPPSKAAGQEVLDYGIEWRLVTAGRAKLSWGPGPGNPQAGFETKLHLESLGLVSRLFRVNDDYTADLSENFCAENTFMTAHENARERETKVVYDSKLNKAIYHEHDLIKNTNISSEVVVPPCVHDVVGGLYQLRRMNLEPGKSTQIPVSDGKKSVMLKIECQRREDIKTPLGPRKTLLYEIFAFNDVLYRRSGHLHVWLTDDARKVPVQIQIRLQFTIGTITLRLEKEEKT